MATQLLTTKLHIPSPRTNLVSRPRLVEQLDEGLRRGHRLTIISAPAGFGKTTMLSEWVGSCKLPIAWVSLDEGDDDPARFWAYFIAALQTIPSLNDAGVGHSVLAAFQSPGSVGGDAPPIEAMLTDLINEIAAVAPSPFILVLDDYHAINLQTIHDALAFLLDHMPVNMHLVIATRVDPPLPIARLRARGQLTELRLVDLRLTRNEVAELLNQVIGLDLAADDVTVLASRTEGWVAGLQMAALALQGMLSAGVQDKVAGFIRAFGGSDRYILDYLVEEVLQRQADTVQTFLLQTAILDRLTGPLCDAVCFGLTETTTGRGASQAILEQLERANLFIVPLDNERQWYRYHRLFSDLLRVRLGQVQPDSVSTLHRRASRWYEHNGLTDAAIEHALSAGDAERAAGLIEKVAEETLMRSEIATFLRWIEKLPDELVCARPTLCLFHAWALLLAGRPLDAVESRLQDIGEDTDLALGRVASLRAYIAVFRGEIARAAELSHQALEHLSEEDSFLRGIAAMNLGVFHSVSSGFVAGSQALDEVIRMSQQAGNVMIAVMTLCNLAELHVAQGQLYKAKDVYQRALESATDRQGRPLPIAGMPLIGLGDLSREWNDLEAATRYLTEGIERIRQWGEIGALDGYISLARVRQAQGDVHGARHAIRKARQLAIKFDATDLDDFMVDIHQVRLWVAQGDFEATTRWVEERGSDMGVGLAESRQDASYLDYQLRQRERITLARVWIAQDQHDEALALLEPIARVIKQQELRSNRRVIELHILRALAFQAQGNIARALVALEQAVSLAEPGGYVRIFVDEGPPMARLLYRAAARGITPEYTGKLLAAFEIGTKAGDSSLVDRPSSLVEPLSERELEVLQLVAEGLSNREIAQRLFISLRTVKWHTSNIYGKLGVKNRTQAVARARTLGILPDSVPSTTA